jgi:hypothetical protein
MEGTKWIMNLSDDKEAKETNGSRVDRKYRPRLVEGVTTWLFSSVG